MSTAQIRARSIELPIVGFVRPPASLLLVEVSPIGPDDMWVPEVSGVSLAKHGTLFRRFAELDTADKQALLNFANDFGPLGCQRDVDCDRSGPAGKMYYARINSPQDHAQPTVRVPVELYAEWVENIVLMRTATAVYDLLRAKDRAGLRRHFRPRPTEAPDAAWWLPPGKKWWMIDTRPDLPVEESREDRVSGLVIVDEFADVTDVAWTWLINTTNNRLSKTSPKLRRDSQGNFTEELAPDSLLAAMWAQVCRAITGNKGYSRCRECGGWFEVSKGAGTTRKVFCSGACRVREHRRLQK